MKSVFLCTLFSFSAFSAVNFEGTFTKNYPVQSFGFSKKECKESGGKFNAKEGSCLFEDGGATAQVKKNNEKYEIVLSSVGHNLHTCEYQGEATAFDGRTLVSRNNEMEGEPACVISLNYKSNNELDIETNGECQEWCGAYMSLDEQGLLRK